MSGTIHNLIDRLNAITADVRTSFGGFDEEQLNWKPSSESWSVAQCLDHLITSNATYFPTLEGVASGTFKPGAWTRVPFAADLFGRMIKKAVHPDNVKKYKTMPVFEPARSEIPASVVEDFAGQQEKLKVIFEKLDDQELLSKKISSPASGLITLRVADALEILALHERRHFNQAVRVTELSDFPAQTGES